MEIHPSALIGGRSRQSIYDAIENARITTHIGNAPTQIFVLGEDGDGCLLEVSSVVRHEDILVVHVAEARADYRPLADMAAPAARPTDRHYGTSADGLVLTDELVAELHAVAAAGYDVERLSTRTRPGRPAPLTVGGAVRLGLDRDLRARVDKEADRAGVPMGDYIEQALRAYLATAEVEAAPSR